MKNILCVVIILPDNIYNFSKSEHESDSDQETDDVSIGVVGWVGCCVCGCCCTDASSTSWCCRIPCICGDWVSVTLWWCEWAWVTCCTSCSSQNTNLICW